MTKLILKVNSLYRYIWGQVPLSIPEFPFDVHIFLLLYSQAGNQTEAAEFCMIKSTSFFHQTSVVTCKIMTKIQQSRLSDLRV